MRSATPGHGGIFVGFTESKETNRLVSADSPALYARPGYLLFLAGTDLMAQPIDLGRLEMTGVPVRVAERVQYNPVAGGYGAFSVSQNNTLVYNTGSARMSFPRFPQDGSKVAVAMTAENGNTGRPEVYVHDTGETTS